MMSQSSVIRVFLSIALTVVAAMGTMPAQAEPVILADGQIYNIYESGIVELDDGSRIIGMRVEYANSDTSPEALTQFADDLFEAEPMSVAPGLEIAVVVIGLYRDNGEGEPGEELDQITYSLSPIGSWARQTHRNIAVQPSELYPSEPATELTLPSGATIIFEPAVYVYDRLSENLLVLRVYSRDINPDWQNAEEIISETWNEIIRDQPILAEEQFVRFEMRRVARRDRFHVRVGFSAVLTREGTGDWPVFDDLQQVTTSAGGAE